MLKVFEIILIFIFKIDDLLTKKLFKEIKGALFILLCLFCASILGFLIDQYLHSNIVFLITARLIGIYIYLLIPFAFLSYGEVKKYMFFGKKYYYKEIFKKMNILSYLLFVFWFSTILLYPIIGMSIMLNINFVFNINKVLMLIFVLFISSIFWFAYHIVFDTEPLHIVRKELTLYIAVMSTISLFFLDGYFNIIITYLILSYCWVQYLIESKECIINRE